MSVIYFLAFHYPFWGFPVGIILAEMGWSHRKRGHFKKGIIYGGTGGILILLGVAFFVFNGFDRIEKSMKSLERKYITKQ